MGGWWGGTRHLPCPVPSFPKGLLWREAVRSAFSWNCPCGWSWVGFSQPQQLCDSFCPSWLIFLLWLQAPLGQQWSSCTRSSGQPRPSFLCTSRPGSRPASGALSGLALPLPAPSPSKNMPFHRKFHFHSPGLFMLFPSSNITEECLTSSPPVNPVFASCHPYLPALPPAPPFFTNYLLSLASDDPDMLNSCPWNLLCPPALGLRCSVSVRTRARSWLPKTSFVGSQTLLHMRLPWGNGSTPPPAGSHPVPMKSEHLREGARRQQFLNIPR